MASSSSSNSSFATALQSKTLDASGRRITPALHAPLSTDLLVTVNTLKYPRTEEEMRELQNKVIRSMEGLSTTALAVTALNRYTAVIGEGRPVLKDVVSWLIDPNYFSFEFSANTKPSTSRLHVHFMVNITHNNTDKWGPKDQQRGLRLRVLIKAFQLYFTDSLDLRAVTNSNRRTSPYVHVDVIHSLSRVKNYINKYATLGAFVRNKLHYEDSEATK